MCVKCSLIALPPKKILHNLCFYFSWVLQPSQEKLKTMLMQNFGGQIRCIMGDVQVAKTQHTEHTMKSC